MPGSQESSTDEDRTAELTAAFSAAAEILFSTRGATHTLQRVVDQAVETIEGCDLAGIFVLAGDTVATAVYTDPMVLEIDALQHGAREGPCLDALANGGSPSYADDLADDDRWPIFGPQSAAAGIRSILALRLAPDGTTGALNLYARYPHAFGVVDRGKALILATLAGLALGTAYAHEAEERRATNLTTALVTRQLIGQAEGILMERERITSNQAFDLLRRASQHLNLKLRDVAQALVDTGETPDTGDT